MHGELTCEVVTSRRLRTSGAVPGEPALWILVIGDLSMFGAFFLIFMSYRDNNLAEFSTAHAEMSIRLGIINTLVLLTGSWAAFVALGAARLGKANGARIFVGVTILSAALFAVIKVVEYGDKYEFLSVSYTNPFWMLYFGFTGVHFLHVIMCTALLIKLVQNIPGAHGNSVSMSFMEGVLVLWHMVDLIWIVLFSLFYVMGA